MNGMHLAFFWRPRSELIGLDWPISNRTLPFAAIHALLLAERIVGEEGKIKTIERLTQELSPQAQAMVPDSVKADLLQSCRRHILS
jgi:hypothetical protein